MDEWVFGSSRDCERENMRPWGVFAADVSPTDFNSTMRVDSSICSFFRPAPVDISSDCTGILREDLFDLLLTILVLKFPKRGVTLQ